jgi:hypothetical protein
MPTLLDLAARSKSKTNQLLTSDLVKRSGLLRTMEFSKASHSSAGYDIEIVSDNVVEASFRAYGAGISSVDPKSHEVTHQLKPFSVYHKVDAAYIANYEGGLSQYLIDKAPQIAEGAGQKLATQMFYGSDTSGFEGLRQIAIKNNNKSGVTVCFKPAGAAASSGTTSIYCVRWDPREMCGLYKDGAFQRGAFMIKVMNGGNPVSKEDSDGNTYYVYEFAFETYLSLKNLSNIAVSMVYNLKDASTFYPTLALMRKAKRAVRGMRDNTYFYVNSFGQGLIDDNVSTTIYRDPNDTEAARELETVSGIRIVIDDNISSDEDATEV